MSVLTQKTPNHEMTEQDELPTCLSGDEQHHATKGLPDISPEQYQQIANMLKALADTARLELVVLLRQAGEVCVSELVEQTGEKMSTVSNRLKQLHEAGLVNKRRDAQHIYYSLQDEHVYNLLDNLLAHASHL